jgi:transposase
MPTRCPDCGEVLEELDPFGEMASRPKRFRCGHCQLAFERDAGGSLVELE